MSIVLTNQVAASEKSADEIEEKLSHEHRCAMLSFDVRDLAKQVVSLFHDINADVDRVRKAIETASDAAAQEMTAAISQWGSLYTRLAVVFEKTAHLIHGVELIGPNVDGKPEFYKAWRSVRATVCFSEDVVSNSLDQMQRNEARSLGEIKRALLGSPNDNGGTSSSQVA